MTIHDILRGGYSITYEEIANGKLDELLHNGLKVFAICEYGERSSSVAWSLHFNQRQQVLPASSLAAGLGTLRDKSRDPMFEKVIKKINKVETIAIVMHSSEYDPALPFINENFRNHDWVGGTIARAVNEILNMYY